MPTQSVDAVLAQHPKFTLPTASASVGETVSLGEYDGAEKALTRALQLGADVHTPDFC